MFLKALFFQGCSLNYCLKLEPLALAFYKLVCLEEGYTFQAAYEALFFFPSLIVHIKGLGSYCASCSLGAQ